MLNLNLQTQKSQQTQLKFTVSLARTGTELEEVQRLRYKVFCEEMGASWHGAHDILDYDQFDYYCEHLLVRNNNDNKIVSTCRILPPEQAQARGSYFTETDFDLSRLSLMRTRMAEVSLLCSHYRYRDRATITELWNGLNHYMDDHSHQFLIGCVNLSMGDGGHYAASVYCKIRQQYAAPPEYRVFPHCPLPLGSLNRLGSSKHLTDVSIPPLVKNFLRQGAFVCGAPAWNSHFNTADLFMLLPLSHRGG